MADFPLLWQLAERLCVVVGGGPVGRRKAAALHQAGARVRLIDPEAGPDLPGIEAIPRPYRSGDLAGADLAFAAAGREVNAAVVREARAARIPVNVADRPRDGDFTLPAALHRGDLTVAVSTGGRSPALAAVLRDQLAGGIGPEWGVMVAIAAAMRQKKLTGAASVAYNQEILRQLLAGHLPDLLAAGAAAEIDRLLTAVGGEGCTLARLGIRLPKGKT